MGWQWHQLGHMQIICTSLQTNNHDSKSSLNLLQAGCSSWRPNNSVKALKAITIKTLTILTLCTIVVLQIHPWLWRRKDFENQSSFGKVKARVHTTDRWDTNLFQITAVIFYLQLLMWVWQNYTVDHEGCRDSSAEPRRREDESAYQLSHIYDKLLLPLRTSSHK